MVVHVSLYGVPVAHGKTGFGKATGEVFTAFTTFAFAMRLFSPSLGPRRKRKLVITSHFSLAPVVQRIEQGFPKP